MAHGLIHYLSFLMKSRMFWGVWDRPVTQEIEYQIEFGLDIIDL